MSDIDKVHLRCPKCQKRLAVKTSLAGKRVRCPDKACATLIRVPGPAPSQDVEAARPRPVKPRPAAAARRPWFVGGAAALVVVLAIAVGLGAWALNRGVQTAPEPAPTQPSADAVAVVARTNTPTNDATEVNKTAHAFKPGDWFLWKHSMNDGKTSSTTRHTITRADDKAIVYAVESSSSANEKIKKDTGQFAVERLGKSPFADDDTRNQILGKGKETLTIGGKSIACDWVEYKSSEAGDPMKYKVNEVAYGETIVTTGKAWYSAQVPALVVKNETKTSYIVPPQVPTKWVPAARASTYELVDMGSNTLVAAPIAKPAPPKVVGEALPSLAQLAGEWAELKLGHYLHLDADGFGYGLVKLFGVHTVEIRIRKADGRWGLDFPDEVSFGPGRRELRSKPMTIRLTDPGTLELSDAAGMRWYRLTRMTRPRERPKLNDFAGDWKVSSVTADGPAGVKDGRTRVLKLMNLKLALGADGKGTAQFLRGDKPDGPPVPLSLKEGDEACALDGLEGQSWEARFFYLGDNLRLMRLRTKDGATRMYTNARRVDAPMEKPNIARTSKTITKEGLAGIWEGTSTDRTAVELLFKDTLVVVSILAPGTNRAKAREAAEWASGDFGRGLGGGGFGIGSMEYQIDAANNEVKIPGPGAVVKPTEDGGLLVSGSFKISGTTYTVPETRLQRVKRDEIPGKTPPQEKRDAPPKKATPQTLPPEEGSLPKPKGPRLTELAKLPANVELDGIYLAGPFMRDQRSREWPQAFPAGTDETCIVVVLRSVPPGTQVAAEVASAGGPIKLAPSTVRTIQTAAQTIIELTCAPASGTYADGDYTTKVLINRTAVATLHWCVGGKEPTRNVIALGGTVWQSRFNDGSGYELHFGDGGKLDVQALPGAGKSTWQTKKGTWQQRGGTFTGFADQDGAPRRRIEFRGKLIDANLGIRIRNENEKEAGSFGSWYEIPRGNQK